MSLRKNKGQDTVHSGKSLCGWSAVQGNRWERAGGEWTSCLYWCMFFSEIRGMVTNGVGEEKFESKRQSKIVLQYRWKKKIRWMNQRNMIWVSVHELKVGPVQMVCSSLQADPVVQVQVHVCRGQKVGFNHGSRFTKRVKIYDRKQGTWCCI